MTQVQRSKKRVFLLLFASVVFLAPAVARACSCGYESMKWSFKWSDAVVIAAADTTIEKNGLQTTTFRVAEEFKGGFRPGQLIVVETNPMGESCGFAFQSGSTYLLQLNRKTTGVMTTGLCSHTGNVMHERVANDVKLLHRRAAWWRTPFSSISFYPVLWKIRNR